MDDRQAQELNERLDQLERDNRDRLQELLAEIQRRDRWIISSIWNFIGSFNNLLIAVGIMLAIKQFDVGTVGSIAIVLLGFVAFFLLHNWTGRLEEDDKLKIERGSLLSSWLWDRR